MAGQFNSYRITVFLVTSVVAACICRSSLHSDKMAVQGATVTISTGIELQS